MAIELAWYMSCDGDSAHIGQKYADHPPSYDTFTRIAQNAERSGFTTILVPTSQVSGHYGPQAPTWDSIVNAAVIGPATKTIKLLLAVRVGIIDPAICARMMASLDELTNGRILYNIVTGGAALSNYGEELDHDARYERTDEYLQILEGLWTQEKYSFEGNFYRLKDATVYPRPVQKPRIHYFMAGASDVAQDIAIRRAEYSVFWGESPEQVAERVEHMNGKCERAGRTRALKYVTRFQIFARETEAEAFEAAEEVMRRVDPDVLAHRGKVISSFDSKGTREQTGARARGDGGAEPLGGHGPDSLGLRRRHRGLVCAMRAEDHRDRAGRGGFADPLRLPPPWRVRERGRACDSARARDGKRAGPGPCGGRIVFISGRAGLRLVCRGCRPVRMGGKPGFLSFHR